MRPPILTSPRRRCLAVLVAVALPAACGAAGKETAQVERTIRGDTTILLSVGARDTAAFDSVATLWQSDSLEAPHAMALVDSTLVVAERTRVHLVRLGAGGGAKNRAATVGRQGQGPGEFSSIRALGVIGEDTALVYDQRNQRLTYLSSIGEVMRIRQVAGIAAYPNISSGDRLVAWRGGILMPRSSVMSLRAPTTHALVWYDPAADTSTALLTWPGSRIVDLGSGSFAPAEMFGATVHIAVNSDGRVAAGDGLEYCVNLHLASDRGVTRLCRDRERASVGEELRAPDVTGLSPALKTLVENMLRTQIIGDKLPSYDRLMWAEDGSLWVRTMGPENANVIPVLARWRPELAPPNRYWDVFDPEGGFTETVRLPSAFTPWVVLPDVIYGFWELDSGEIVLGAAPRSNEWSGGGA